MRVNLHCEPLFTGTLNRREKQTFTFKFERHFHEKRHRVLSIATLKEEKNEEDPSKKKIYIRRASVCT